jgi:phosphoribosylaminoimidazolecarboxamide formyltransferase / IMP cyclohydrolase
VTTAASAPAAAPEGRAPIRRALISVYDKTGLEDLARGLHAAGVALVSTGKSAALIRGLGIPVTEVAELTGFPECLDGRVKTLHPTVHAGILADRRLPEHVRQLDELGIEPFDLVVSNLYPFTATVASGAGPDECVEQIDIGGPSMVRAAAKNHPSVAILVNPDRYGDALAAVEAGGFTLRQRKRLAAEAFAHTATYDAAVASWFASSYAPVDESPQDGPAASALFPDFLATTWNRKAILRYGENPHQAAALYTGSAEDSLATAEQLHGKEMSFNNYVDTDAALRTAYDFEEPCVAIIKHANPCGIAVSVAADGSDGDIADAHRKAHACDPVSAYGGVIATNRPVSVEMARQVSEVFTEVICAPAYEDGAVEILSAKKNIRLLRTRATNRRQAEFRQICGGLLLQSGDRFQAAGDDPANWRLAAGPAATPAMLADLAFAWRAVRAVKSNAILLVSGLAAVGVGMGQVNRVDSARLAASRAGDRATGSAAASDAFFPFADGLQVLIDAGVRAVVQPGGSVRDEDVLAAAEAAGVTMYLTGTRHFAH